MQIVLWDPAVQQESTAGECSKLRAARAAGKHSEQSAVSRAEQENVKQNTEVLVYLVQVCKRFVERFEN